jgi:hypothetical protein
LEISNNGQLLLTMDLYDAAGTHIAKLRRNAWAFHQSRFDITTRPDDLTLTDIASGDTVLKARVLGPDIIDITQGAFFTHKGTLLEITPHYFRVGQLTTSGNVLDGNGTAFGIG